MDDGKVLSFLRCVWLLKEHFDVSQRPLHVQGDAGHPG
jgi:hypothetical protein